MGKIKYFKIIIITLLATSLFSFAQTNDSFLPTRLRATIIDGLGNPVQGVTVNIYTSEDDYRESENEVGTGVTNEKGIVLFKNLEPIPYYIDARKGDLNNEASGVQTGSLEEGKLNKINTIID